MTRVLVGESCFAGVGVGFSISSKPSVVDGTYRAQMKHYTSRFKIPKMVEIAVVGDTQICVQLSSFAHCKGLNVPSARVRLSFPGPFVRTICPVGHGAHRFARECECYAYDNGSGIDVDRGSLVLACLSLETFLERTGT